MTYIVSSGTLNSTPTNISSRIQWRNDGVAAAFSDGALLVVGGPRQYAGEVHCRE